MENKRPVGHGKKVGSGSARAEKGEQVSSRPVGTGSGRTGSFDQRPENDRAGGERSNAGKLGLLALLMILPKKYRRLLLLVVAVLAVFGLMTGRCNILSGEDLSYYPATDQTAQVTVVPYYTQAPAATAIPYYTEAPVLTMAPVVTRAPEATAAPLVGEARAKRITPLGNGRDTVTVMIYMCGTDLESKYGMGTSDLGEMVKATISDKVNVIVETGGCRAWKNNIVSSSVNQIYQVQTGGLKRLESNFGTAAMTNPDNLATFIQYCAKNFPANRNILILWDHGGGSLSGYGYDEKQSTGFTSAASMTLPQIDAALKKGGCTFDWIGFDACLMATLETAMVCNPYADYMIASEESEPGTGWYYTDWLTALSQNTSASTESIGKVIVDTFISASQRAQANAQVTLSVLDLAKMQGTVPGALRSFSTATTALIKGNGYNQVANARANVRQFARQSRINQVDLIDLCDRIGTGEAKTLAAALKGCVAYNKTSISRAYGVSIYFPYETLSGVKSAISTYNSLGIDSEYAKCIQSFASLEQGGQFASSASQQSYGSYSSGGDLLSTLLGGFMDSSSYGSSGSSPYGSSSPLGSLMQEFTTGAGSGSYSAGNSVDVSTIYDLLSAFSGRSMPAALSWVDTDLVADKAADIAQNRLDPARITVTDKDGVPTLVLTDGEWALVETAAVNVFVDDGQGFIDLGCDNYLEYDQDEDLILGYDGTWLCLDGHVAAFYMTEAGEDGTYGRIPARITREADGETQELLMNIMVFIDGQGDAAVLGADPLYAGETDTQAKGSIPLEQGDSIQLLCDYYAYDGAFEGSYELGEAFTVADDVTLEYLRLENEGDLSVSYRLTDVYGNTYWTPACIY